MGQTMKIAFAVPAYWPSVIGVSLYCQELAEGLVKKGHHVTVYTGLQPRWKKVENKKGVVIKRFERTYIGKSFYFVPLMEQEIIKDGPDIVHSHHYGYYEATAGLGAAKNLKVPHIFGPYYHPPVYGIKKKILWSAYHHRYGKSLLTKSDVVLPHTEVEKNLLKKIGATLEKMIILPNTVNTKKFRPIKKRNKIITIGFISNLIHEKGAHIAMEIAEDLIKERQDVEFVFIGNPHEKNLVKRITSLKKTGKASFLKNLSEKNLIKYYNKIDITILPSKYEAFGKVLAEAQACGTPVVATNAGGIPEVVINKKTGLLSNYGDWGIFKRNIEKLIENESLRRKFGLAGRKHVVKNFDTKVVVNKLEKIYNTATNP